MRVAQGTPVALLAVPVQMRVAQGTPSALLAMQVRMRVAPGTLSALNAIQMHLIVVRIAVVVALTHLQVHAMQDMGATQLMALAQLAHLENTSHIKATLRAALYAIQMHLIVVRIAMVVALTHPQEYVLLDMRVMQAVAVLHVL